MRLEHQRHLTGEALLCEQLELAASIVAEDADLEAPDLSVEELYRRLIRLATLVLARDEWRRKAGPEPYGDLAPSFNFPGDGP